MARTNTTTTNNNMNNNKKPRRGCTTSSLLLAVTYSLAAVLILQGVTPTAAAKIKTANTMDDASDMVEDFAREVMRESIIDM